MPGSPYSLAVSVKEGRENIHSLDNIVQEFKEGTLAEKAVIMAGVTYALFISAYGAYTFADTFFNK